ncbi:hypothetical protein KY290_030876 [Solanum tuberosum]|uniref:Tf2-1-like SH3-like domain-containing protein n=1 Tax=Solanum tuberosum TaxID=4113 RepID=A0ABQ7U8U5_SOLTU|nr:hypothetical protein KY289_030117 [Solanum tuberosum]KAH0742883.1 hypothetical protein KY290_030876 [Solanum tuberosum]
MDRRSGSTHSWSAICGTMLVSRSEATRKSPFELATGQQPNTPQSLPVDSGLKSSGAYHVAKSWEEQVDLARSYLDKAAQKMKKFADRKRRPVDYRIGDRAGKISFRVDMPNHLKIHPVFHASQLKPYFEDAKDKDRGQIGRAQIFITPPAVDKQIEAIIDHQLKGTTPEEATWEKYEDLWQFRDKVHSYLQVCGVGVVAKSGGGTCTAPQGATLNSSSSEAKADSRCASAGLKRRVNYSPAFGVNLETLEEHVGALTFSQKWGPTEGTRLT